MYIKDMRKHDYCTLGDLKIGDCFIDNGYICMKIATDNWERRVHHRASIYERVLNIPKGEVFWEVNTTPIKECVAIKVEMYDESDELDEIL